MDALQEQLLLPCGKIRGEAYDSTFKKAEGYFENYLTQVGM